MDVCAFIAAIGFAVWGVVAIVRRPELNRGDKK